MVTLPVNSWMRRTVSLRSMEEKGTFPISYCTLAAFDAELVSDRGKGLVCLTETKGWSD